LVKIRLKRMGATKRPIYRIVVADSRSPRDGRFIESIGFYDPLRDPAVVRVDADKVRMWMRNGARPSEAARALLVREGILAPTPRPARATKRPAETPEAAASQAAAPEVSAGDISAGVDADEGEATEQAVSETSQEEES
jgi:small subunit ribosomal protein S16